jgi:hypothetical protein
VDKDGCHIGLVEIRWKRAARREPLARQRRAAGDPSRRLENGCARDDAAKIRHRLLVTIPGAWARSRCSRRSVP